MIIKSLNGNIPNASSSRAVLSVNQADARDSLKVFLYGTWGLLLFHPTMPGTLSFESPAAVARRPFVVVCFLRVPHGQEKSPSLSRKGLI